MSRRQLTPEEFRRACALLRELGFEQCRAYARIDGHIPTKREEKANDRRRK